MFWATTILVFLGLLIDTVNRQVSIPVEKIEKALDLIETMLGKKSKKCTLLQLQKTCGFLNFISRCVLPGRAFTRQLYAYTSRKDNGIKQLKPHHHIHINAKMRHDLETWRLFLHHPSAFCRSFIDFDKTWNADDIDFYTDASGKTGFGGICGTSWMFGFWSEKFLKYHPSIEYLELYALVAAVLAWIDRFYNQRVVIFCDNKSV